MLAYLVTNQELRERLCLHRDKLNDKKKKKVDSATAVVVVVENRKVEELNCKFVLM